MKISEFILYTAPSGQVKIEVYIRDETIWLSQQKIAQLFGVDRSSIGKHLKNIFASAELDEQVVCAIFSHTTQHGAIPNKTQTQSVKYYNLDAIISVGYRVNSTRATQFRIWATKTLKEYLIKGFVLDDERLKRAKTTFGKDYFKELLERVRSIRASERRIYQQVTDIFAECSIDYDPKSSTAHKFYATVQNKFHYAITGKTAAEIIYEKADSNKEYMGLMTWKNAPKGRILKSDTNIAKNYLNEKQIKQLERSVSGYFDYIESLIERENTFTMSQLALSVNKFLTFNEYKVYDKFNKTQKIESDFDNMVKNLKQKNN